MAKIRYKCPHCEKETQVREVAVFDIKIATDLDSLRIIGDPSSDTFRESYAESRYKEDSEEEVERDFSRIIGYECSECGDEICDENGSIEDETALARYLDENGMLERDSTDSELPLEGSKQGSGEK